MNKKIGTILTFVAEARAALEKLRPNFHHEAWYRALSTTLDQFAVLRRIDSVTDGAKLGEVYCKQVDELITALLNLKENHISAFALSSISRPTSEASEVFGDILIEQDYPELDAERGELYSNRPFSLLR